MTAKPRILFVDDEPNVLDALGRAFRNWGADWEMVFETDPLQAIAEQKTARCAVAVVDIHMPALSGLELLRRLEADNPTLVSIILTGADDIAMAATAINDAHVFRFYSKPCSADILARGIADALAESQQRNAVQHNKTGSAVLSTATLDRLPHGVIVVDGHNHILFSNRQGAAILAARDGLSVAPDGSCRCGRAGETQELQRLIRDAIRGDTPPRALSIARQNADRPLSLIIAPLTEQSPGAAPSVVLLISDPDQRTLPSVETVCHLFDLTEAEARLALALSEGHRIEDAAERLGITTSSARTYLKRVFSKTEVTRQAELVRLILAAPTLLPLGAPPSTPAQPSRH